MSRTSLPGHRTPGLGTGLDPIPKPRDPRLPQRLPGTGKTDGPDGRPFPWGPVVEVHRVGAYAIVEYREDMSNLHVGAGMTIEAVLARHGRHLFHPYVDDRDTGRSFTSLDSALVGAVGFRREGPNGRAAEYFDKMTEAVS